VSVFFLAYLRNELLRRRARTILTLLGLALGVALVIAIAALSRGLDRAQKTALDPLASIGTDLSVTQSADAADPREMFASTRSVVTDLSKLGKPGDKFVHDFFLPGTQPSFQQDQAKAIEELPGVAGVAQGLTLLAVHQEGTVPEIVARFQTGGQEFRIDRAIKPLTDAERAKVQACLEENGGGAQPRPAQPGQGGGGLRFGLGPINKCLPERFKRVRETFVTPRETLEQVLDPPQTNIESEPYTIAGVDTTKPGMGLVTPQQVRSGRFLARGAREALVTASYARRHELKVGSKLNLNGTRFTVVGLVEPPLGGQSADVYLPLGRLQKLAGQEGAANVVLVRADSSADVAAVQKAIEETLGDVEVASAEQVADRITGSLVDAADLSRTLGVALSVAAALAAFLLAALLTLASVGKRVRELGTLKALGWTQGLVVRQVVGESLAQGLAGGLLGVVLGVGAAAAIGAFGPTLDASSASEGGGGFFGLGDVAARTVTSDVTLTAPLTAWILLLGFALAVAGGLLAGAAGALRAARLRPAEALRRVD
jgi:ABC-type antimicrobial peptide transport system permease subunit